MSGLAIVGAAATIISTMVAAFVAAWGARVSARSKAADAKVADRAANNESIEIGHKVLIDGIEWSKTQLSELREANSKLQTDLNSANASRFAAERRLIREAREKSELQDQNDVMREEMTEMKRKLRELGVADE